MCIVITERGFNIFLQEGLPRVRPGWANGVLCCVKRQPVSPGYVIMRRHLNLCPCTRDMGVANKALVNAARRIKNRGLFRGENIDEGPVRAITVLMAPSHAVLVRRDCRFLPALRLIRPLKRAGDSWKLRLSVSANMAVGWTRNSSCVKRYSPLVSPVTKAPLLRISYDFEEKSRRDERRN
jgi:hypothetical protein